MKASTRIGLVGLAALGLQLPSVSQTFQEVYAFRGGVDGGGPGNLIQARDGTFYGMTSSGGASGLGTIFKLTRDGKLKTLVSFDGTNALQPSGPLLQASNGDFYGTMSSWSEAPMSGTVFRMTPSGEFATLVRFTGRNGAYPIGSLVEGDDGNLYGVTSYGGDDYVAPDIYSAAGYGTIFKITPGGVLTTLVSFSTNHLEQGIWPAGPLTKARDGSFYGTTWRGTNWAPTAYRLTPDGKLRTVASLCCDPHGQLLQASDGNLYGLAGFGFYGNAEGPMGLFWMTPDGAFTYLNCFPVHDDYMPESLIEANDGDIYGITSGYYWSTDAGRQGKVFKFTLSRELKEVLSFTGTNGPYPGHHPTSLLQARDGNLYGTTFLDGSGGNGNIFRLVMLGPLLNGTQIGPELILSWRTNYVGFTLKSSQGLSPPKWIDSTNAPVIVNGQFTVTVPVSGNERFFRLEK